jgi:predicted nucleic acid-binding protein
MISKLFYVDSCIWLNFFKKEQNVYTGFRYGEVAKKFIDKIIFSENNEIIYTGFVLKELKSKLNTNEFNEKLLFLKNEFKFKFEKAMDEDYNLARKLESESKYEISFFDCIHVAICKRLDAVLVTRDRLLIEFARKYIEVRKPEDLLA